LFFFSSRRRHTSFSRDWSSDVCSSDLVMPAGGDGVQVGVVGALRVGGHAEYLWFSGLFPGPAGRAIAPRAALLRIGVCVGAAPSRRWPAKRSGKSTQYAWR